MKEANELPEGWVWTTTEQVCSSIRDGTHDTPKYTAEGIPLITSKNLKENGLDFSTTLNISMEDHRKISVRSGVEEGDVLFAMIGTIGNPVVVRTERIFSIKNVGLFKKDESILNSEYLKYWLSSWVFNKILEENQLVKGTTQKFIPLGHLRILPFPLAPLSEQYRIVTIIEQQFSRLDAGVAALRKAQAKLKRYRAAVLKAAVEGKLTEAWCAEHPTTEPASILLEQILRERRTKWEADLKAKGKDPAKVKYVEPAKPDVEGLPRLPEGWCWASFEQISERVTVGHVGLMRDEYIDNGIPFLRSQNVRPNYFDQNGLKFISYEFHRKLSKSALEPGDILVVRSGSVGVACVMPNIYEEANCSDLVIVKQPIKVNSHYAAYYMNSTAQDRVRAEQVGIALTHFNTRSMAAMPLPLPPIAEQEQIVFEVEQRLSIITQLEATVEANLKRAERLRQSILKEAFAGWLVPQDPNDEPASVLLERIRMEREEQKKGVAGNGRHAKVSSEPVKIDVEGTRQVESWEGVGG